MFFYFLLTALLSVPLAPAHASVAQNTAGKILLQVEQNGEAWYINPGTLQRYYLGRPADAFNIMRELGLGIAKQELHDYLNSSFPSRLSGKIMLSVEENGEAYYVYPNDLKGYYLGRPADAFNVMRTLGLGISDRDLGAIAVSSDSAPVVVASPETSPTEDDTESTSDFSPVDVFLSNVTAEIVGDEVHVTSNGLPDHETGTFPNSGNPNTISEQDIDRTFALSPTKNVSATNGGGYEFGIAVNGIPFEPLTGEYWNNDRNSGWNLEWSTNNLGFDFNNAHVQPNGLYHYHGSPTSLLAAIDGKAQTLIGFAADGFPIYVENLTSSWQLKSGTRPNGPGGTYDGTYVQDYEYVEGLGDLDACNGIFSTTPEYPNGVYHYVVSETFPVIGRCFSGAPDPSFQKGAGQLPPGGGPPPPQL